MSRLSRTMLPALIFVIAAAGCTASASTPNLPNYVLSAPPTVREAYEYAVAHPDELAYQPCYCGCNVMGHTSSLHCFVRDITPDGTIIFDTHALGCGICVDIARDVMRLRAQGQSPLAVRTYIDAQYGMFGPSTDTPLPEY